MSTRKWRIVNFVLNIAKKWSAEAEVTWPADGTGSRPTSPLMHERLELWWNYIHLMKMEHEQPFYRCKELYFIVLIVEENKMDLRVKLVFEYEFEISWSFGPWDHGTLGTWDSWTSSLLQHLCSEKTIPMVSIHV